MNGLLAAIWRKRDGGNGLSSLLRRLWKTAELTRMKWRDPRGGGRSAASGIWVFQSFPKAFWPRKPEQGDLTKAQSSIWAACVGKVHGTPWPI